MREAVMRASLLSHFSRVQLFVTPWTVARQAPLSLGFSRQEYWRGLPFPSPGHLPYPGIKPTFPTSPALAGRFFTTSTIWEGQSPYTERERAELDPPCLSDVSVGVANTRLILQHVSGLLTLQHLLGLQPPASHQVCTV